MSNITQIQVGNTVYDVTVGCSTNTVNNAENSLAVGYYNDIQNSNSLAVGDNNQISSGNSVTVGYRNVIRGYNSLVVGWGNEQYGNNAILFGSDARSRVSNAVCGNSKATEATYTNLFGHCGFKGIRSTTLAEVPLFNLNVADTFIATIQHIKDNHSGDTSLGVFKEYRICVRYCEIQWLYDEAGTKLYNRATDVDVPDIPFYVIDGVLKMTNGYDESQTGIFYTLYSESGAGDSSSSGSGSSSSGYDSSNS